MNIHNFLFCVIFSTVGLVSVFSDGDFLQYTACCVYKGRDLEDIEYDLVNRVNNEVLADYNSTRGNWTGYTTFAMKVAHDFNTPIYAARRLFEKKVLCIDNIKNVKKINSLTAVPTIKLNSVKGRSVLVCSAYDFYPKQIQITWLLNGKEVTSAVSFSEVMPSGDWYYQIHSFLARTPTLGEDITCMVKHLSLSEPVLVAWDSSLPPSERMKVAVGTFLLVLGLFSLTIGLLYYKKKSREHLTLCQGRITVPVEDFTETGET